MRCWGIDVSFTHLPTYQFTKSSALSALLIVKFFSSHDGYSTQPRGTSTPGLRSMGASHCQIQYASTTVVTSASFASSAVKRFWLWLGTLRLKLYWLVRKSRQAHALGHVVFDPVRVPPFFRVDLHAFQLHAEVDVV